MLHGFSYYLKEVGEFGVVTHVHHPIVFVDGLPLAKPHEIIVLESGQMGEVFSINKENVEVLVFSKEPVRVGEQVVRTNKTLSVPVGAGLLGNVIDPLGNPISVKEDFVTPSELRDIDEQALGIGERERIKNPLLTGVSLVDMLVPIGKGQRELVIGDRKTGKTSFLLAAIKSQISAGSLVVYAAIARKKSDIKKLEEFFKKEKLMDKVVLVATSSFDSPSLIYLTPYTAMTIAEYFRDIGEDVLLILDDLSSHAKFYREVSLLSKSFPGRDSYPGDIFYTHARLLERAGNFKHEKKGEVAITCFPIVEITEGDLTGYIPTNVMGMTDGHIFFDSNIYYRGRRPAINTSLSVTRVGRQAQNALIRDVNRGLTAFFSVFEKMQNLSHFGAELTESVRHILKIGEQIYSFFDQPYDLIVPLDVQLVVFSMVWLEFIDLGENISEIRLKVMKTYEDETVKKMFKEFVSAGTFNELLSNVSKKKPELLKLMGKKLPEPAVAKPTESNESSLPVG